MESNGFVNLSRENAVNEKFSGAATGPVTSILRLEGAVVLILATLTYRSFGGSWGQYLTLFLVPDVSMLGYLINRRIGALFYNFGHSYLSPALLLLIGELTAIPALHGPALIWFAHIGLDRLAGFGLKYKTGFKDTHLGCLN